MNVENGKCTEERVYGLWFIVYSSWCIVHGSWLLVFGIWNLEFGFSYSSGVIC
jgi:hypothetical protein